MKLVSLISGALALAAANYNLPLLGTVIAQGNGPSGRTFNAKITAKAFDRVNRNLYVGLASGSSSGNNFAISYFDPATSSAIPRANPFADNRILGVNFLTLVTGEGERAPDIAVIPANNPRRVNIMTFNGNFLSLPIDLFDAQNIRCVATSGVVGLAASNLQIFPALRPASNGAWGQANSGIGFVTYTNDFSSILQLNTTPLDPSTAQIRIGATAPTITAVPSTAMSFVPLHWDDRLQRLYVGLELTSGSMATDGVIAITVGSVINNELILENFAPATVFNNTVDTNIVGAISDGTGSKKVGIFNIRSMHTSSGTTYLIVQGGVGSPKNSIFCLPLVNVGDPLDPTQGTLADKTSFDSATKQFIAQPTANAELPDISSISDIFALVGGGPLRLQATNGISDMVVIGDTVYVSVDVVEDLNNQAGIFYSQAQFDQEGKITAWTPWAKRIFPVDGFPSQLQNNTVPVCPIPPNDLGRVAFFDVDAINGKIWAINGSSNTDAATFVATTTWGFGNDSGTAQPKTLVGVLNNALPEGCFSALDLDRATPDIASVGNLPTYALFGGLDKVAIAVVGFSNPPASSQQPITDYTITAFFRVTPLPFNAGAVTSLSYSQQIPNRLNYFFAGTDQGLFVFADPAGSGFLTSDLSGGLLVGPFPTGQWSKVTTILGSVVALKASDNAQNGCLYVVTTQPDPKDVFKSRVYSIPYTNTIATMFAPANIRLIAESGVNAPGSNLQNTLQFFGLENVSNKTTEQLVLATNRGLFTSHADETGVNLGILSATNQQTAVWQQEIDAGSSFYNGVFGAKSAVKSTAWPTTLVPGDCNFFDRSIIRQLSGVPSPTTFSLCPANFNIEHPAPFFNTLDTITHFWSDGARRFFIVKRREDADTSKLIVLPFNDIEWGITLSEQLIALNPLLGTTKTQPEFFTITEAPFKAIKTIYWAQHIGGSGILMLGTDKGILALQ